jgi:nitroreductase
MDIIDAIMNRQSIRHYLDKDVGDDIIKELVKAGCQAPSAHNRQPWAFIVTKDKEKMNEIALNSTYAKFLPTASAAIIVCSHFDPLQQIPALPSPNLHSSQDVAAAAENILLAALNYGLGTCWIGDINDALLRRLFDIPADYRPMIIIAVGYPDPGHMTPKRKRKPLDEVLHWDMW